MMTSTAALLFLISLPLLPHLPSRLLSPLPLPSTSFCHAPIFIALPSPSTLRLLFSSSHLHDLFFGHMHIHSLPFASSPFFAHSFFRQSYCYAVCAHPPTPMCIGVGYGALEA